MNTHADTMARLGATDPAKDLPVDEIERARLWQLIAAMPDRAAPRRPRVRVPRARLALIPVLLALSAGPLAATGVIRFGAGAEPASSLSAPPRGGAEIGRGGGPVSGSVHLLRLTAPDPGGARQWGFWPAALVAPSVAIHEIAGTARTTDLVDTSN